MIGRRLLWVRSMPMALAAISLVIAVACGTSAVPTPTTSGPAPAPTATPVAAAKPIATPAAPASAGKYGGILRLQKHGPPGKLDPHPSVAGLDSAEFAHLYNQVVQYSEVPPTSEIVPDLAQSWEVSQDGLVYTFHLHQNIKWADGKPLTAEDIVFSLNRMVEPGKPRPRAGLIRTYYERSEVVNPQTVRVYLKFPAAAFLSFLGMEYTKILPRHVVEAGVTLPQWHPQVHHQ